MIRPAQLRMMDEDELMEKLRELKAELFNLRFQLATGQLSNQMKIRETRRDIARICTILTEKEYNIHPQAFEEAMSMEAFAPRVGEAAPEETIELSEELEGETGTEEEPEAEEGFESRAEQISADEAEPEDGEMRISEEE